jgi:hypothetical protein
VEWRRGSLTVPEPDAGFLGVDGVEDALVPDLALGSEAYHAPDVRLRRRRGCHRRRSRLGFRCPTHAGLCFFFVPLFCPSLLFKKAFANRSASSPTTPVSFMWTHVPAPPPTCVWVRNRSHNVRPT